MHPDSRSLGMESPIYHFDVVPALNKNVTATQDEVLLSPGDYYNVRKEAT